MAPERDARSLPPGPGPGPAGGAERLPRAFLQSLRTLFDILDDRRRGCVHLREIECRWQGAEARELPPGVLEALRQAAPASGYLTFDCFVQGLRAALLSPDGRGAAHGQGRPPGRGRAPGDKGRGWGGAAGGASRSLEKIPGPPAPAPAARPDGERRGRSAGPREPEQSQGRAAGADAKPIGQSHSESNNVGVADARRHQRGRSEHRRHTITNGVDYSMLKQMKELEQEKDVLLQGLEVVERVREWYHQQIQMVQEHQKYLGKNKASNDFLPEGSQSHLGRLLPKLQEVIHCFSELLTTSGKPLNSPSSVVNRLAAPIPTASLALAGNQQAINMLKEQNRLLTKEVTDKSERITQLEQEKSSLIKQLFEARARSNHETSQLDSTFI